MDTHLMIPSTLSNPQPQPTSRILYLHPDNVKQCIITDSKTSASQALYEVKSNKDFSRTSMTTTPNSSPLIFALIERTIWSEKITLSGRQPIKLTKWLKPQGTFSIFPVMFEEQQRTYIWKSNVADGLSLYLTDEPNIPIAWSHKSSKQMINGVLTLLPAYLVLEQKAIAIQDIVVVSFLVLEHKLRMNLKQAEQGINRAAHRSSVIIPPSF